MKTLKDYISDVIKKENLQPQSEVQKNEVEVPLELKDSLDISDLEESVFSTPHDLPAILIMRRKAIRQYPNGQKVALYYVDKLDKYVTVPYGVNTWYPMSTMDESVIPHLKNIVDNHSAKSIKFKDGKTMKVDVQTANIVLKMHNQLNDENKKKISDMAHKSKEHFSKVVDFAHKHLK